MGAPYGLIAMVTGLARRQAEGKGGPQGLQSPAGGGALRGGKEGP